jgi:hypothetical protein
MLPDLRPIYIALRIGCVDALHYTAEQLRLQPESAELLREALKWLHAIAECSALIKTSK